MVERQDLSLLIFISAKSRNFLARRTKFARDGGRTLNNVVVMRDSTPYSVTRVDLRAVMASWRLLITSKRNETVYWPTTSMLCTAVSMDFIAMAQSSGTPHLPRPTNRDNRWLTASSLRTAARERNTAVCRYVMGAGAW